MGVFPAVRHRSTDVTIAAQRVRVTRHDVRVTLRDVSYTGRWRTPPKVFVLAHAEDFGPWFRLTGLPAYAACLLRETATVAALASHELVYLVDLIGGLDRVRGDEQRRLLCAVDRLELAGTVLRCSPDDVEAIADAWRSHEQCEPFELDWAALAEQTAEQTLERTAAAVA